MNKKKMQILEAAKALFHSKGFAETSITDIITLAKVSKGTFYNHFESKNNCYLAVLTDIHQQTILKRKLIYSTRNPFRMETLIEELVSFHMTLTENDIFDMVFQIFSHKDGIEIFKEIEKQTLYELTWLANRLTEIYGKKIATEAYDHAALLLGTIQFMYRTFDIQVSSKPISMQQIIENVFHKLKPIISQPAKHTILLDPSLFKQLNPLELQTTISLEDIIKDLDEFFIAKKNSLSEESLELTQALLSLLTRAPEKKYLIKSIITTFIKSFNNNPYEKEAFNLYSDTLQWLEQ